MYCIVTFIYIQLHKSTSYISNYKSYFHIIIQYYPRIVSKLRHVVYSPLHLYNGMECVWKLKHI